MTCFKLTRLLGFLIYLYEFTDFDLGFVVVEAVSLIFIHRPI